MKRCSVLYPKQQKQIGFAVSDFNQLVQSACKKFKVPLSTNPVFLLEDGTEVDDNDYFLALPDDTLLIFSLKNETNYKFWSTATNLIAKIWRASLPSKKQLEPLMTRLLADKQMRGEIQNMIEKSTANLKDSRNCDPEWFQGIDENVTSKEAWMCKSAKARIRGYYIRTRDEMEKLLCDSQSGVSNVHYRRFGEVFEKMREELQKNEYHASYFSRSAQNLRLCDEHGSFPCQGEYNESHCQFAHTLNPYGNRESRILFSTWNLDHVIERSRSIIPALEMAIRQARNRQINWKYFYNLLFVARGTLATMGTAAKVSMDGNLKLVHIVCHVKASHAKYKCDKRKYYQSNVRKTTRRKRKK